MCEMTFLGGVCQISCPLRTRDMGFSAERIGFVQRRMPSADVPLGHLVTIAITRDMGFSADMVLGPLVSSWFFWLFPIWAFGNISMYLCVVGRSWVLALKIILDRGHAAPTEVHLILWIGAMRPLLGTTPYSG